MLRVGLVRVANHAEQGVRLRCAVDGELGVENLVPAVLAVGLCKHHQLDIGGVAAQALEGLQQVVHFVVGQRQAPVGVGALQRGAAAAEHIDLLHGRRRQFGEQRARGFQVGQHGFGHAVVQKRCHLRQLRGIQHRFLAQQAGAHLHAVLHHPLGAAHFKTAVACNVGGLGRPGRHRAQARRDHDGSTLGGTGVRVAIVQQRCQALAFGGRGRAVCGHQVHKARRNAGNLRVDGCQGRLQLLGAKRAEGVGARKRGHVQGHVGGLG